MRQKHCTPISARVERRILASLASKEAEPPRLARDILAAEAVERFVSPDTRGPQDEAEFAPPVGHIVDPATIAAAKALVGAALFIAGVAVGKFI